MSINYQRVHFGLVHIPLTQTFLIYEQLIYTKIDTLSHSRGKILWSMLQRLLLVTATEGRKNKRNYIKYKATKILESKEMLWFSMSDTTRFKNRT